MSGSLADGAGPNQARDRSPTAAPTRNLDEAQARLREVSVVDGTEAPNQGANTGPGRPGTCVNTLEELTPRPGLPAWKKVPGSENSWRVGRPAYAGMGRAITRP
jgi:hypothetical protein